MSDFKLTLFLYMVEKTMDMYSPPFEGVGIPLVLYMNIPIGYRFWSYCICVPKTH